MAGGLIASRTASSRRSATRKVWSTIACARSTRTTPGRSGSARAEEASRASSAASSRPSGPETGSRATSCAPSPKTGRAAVGRDVGRRARRSCERPIPGVPRARRPSERDRARAVPGPRGTLWIGADSGGLAAERDGKFTVYGVRDGLSAPTVLAMLEDRNGDLWLGTEGGGLDRFSHGRFTSFTRKEGLSDDTVLALYEDSDGGLWIGTDGGGLNLWKNGKFSRFTRREGLFDDVQYAILEDGRGNLWMSCSRGIFRVRRSDLRSSPRAGAVPSCRSPSAAPTACARPNARASRSRPPGRRATGSSGSRRSRARSSSTRTGSARTRCRPPSSSTGARRSPRRAGRRGGRDPARPRRPRVPLRRALVRGSRPRGLPVHPRGLRSGMGGSRIPAGRLLHEHSAGPVHVPGPGLEQRRRLERRGRGRAAASRLRTSARPAGSTGSAPRGSSWPASAPRVCVPRGPGRASGSSRRRSPSGRFSSKKRTRSSCSSRRSIR